MKVLFQKPRRTLKERKGAPFKRLREEQSPPKETPESQRDERERLELNKAKFGEYSYILGHIDGRIIKTGGNPNQEYYGASMNKPMLALANLILCSDKEVASDAPIDPSTGQPPEGEIRANRPRCLNIKEINGLINYGCRGTDRKDCWGDWRNKSTGKGANVSNELSRALSGAHYKFKKGITPTRKRAKSIEINLDQIKEVWKELGLEGIDKVQHNGNRQTVMGVFKFLSFLNDPKKPYPRQRQTIVNAMKTPFHGHDSEWFREISKVLTRFHIPTKNIYGKGGFFGKALNFGITIDNKWIFVVYSSSSKLKELNKKSTGLAKRWGKKLLHRIMVDALWSQEAAAGRTHTAGPYPRKGSGHPDFAVGMPKKSTCGLKYVNDIPGITFIRARGGDYAGQEMIDYLKGLPSVAPPAGGWIVGDLTTWNCKRPLCTRKRAAENECWHHGGHLKGNQVDICLPMKAGGSSCAPLRDENNNIQKKADGRIKYDFSRRIGGTKATKETLDIEKSLDFLKYTLPKCTFIALQDKLKSALWLYVHGKRLLPATRANRRARWGGIAFGKIGHEDGHQDHFHIQGVGGGSAFHGGHDERAHSTSEKQKRARKAEEETLKATAVAESERLDARGDCEDEYFIKRNTCGGVYNATDNAACMQKIQKEKKECLKALKEEKKQMSSPKTQLEEHLKKQIKAMLLENTDMLNDLDPSQDSRMALYEGKKWEGIKKAIKMFGHLMGWITVKPAMAMGRAITDRTGRRLFKDRSVRPWMSDYPPKSHPSVRNNVYVPDGHKGGPLINPETGQIWKKSDSGVGRLNARISNISPFAREWREKKASQMWQATKWVILPGAGITLTVQQIMCIHKRFSAEEAYNKPEGFWGQRMYDPFQWVNAWFTNVLGASISTSYGSGQQEGDETSRPEWMGGTGKGWPSGKATRHDQMMATKQLTDLLACLVRFPLFVEQLATYIERLEKIAEEMKENRFESKNEDTFKIAHNELDLQRMKLLREMALFVFKPKDPVSGEETGTPAQRLKLYQKCGHMDPEELLVAAGLDPGSEPAPPVDAKEPMPSARHKPRAQDGGGACSDRYKGICLDSADCARTNNICNTRAAARCAPGAPGGPPDGYLGPKYPCSPEFAGVPYMCYQNKCKGAHIGRYGRKKPVERDRYIALADGRKTVPTDGCKGGDKWTKLLTAKWLYQNVFGIIDPDTIFPSDALPFIAQLEIPDGDFGTCWPNKYKDLRPPGWKKKIKVKTKPAKAEVTEPPEKE